MSNTDRLPQVSIAIELAGGAEALLDEAPALARSTIERVADGANALLDELSLPARAAVTLERGPGPNALQLRVNGIRQGCDRAHVARAARFAFASAAVAGVRVGGEPTPIDAEFGEGWARDPDRGPLLAAAVAHAALGLLRRVPEIVITPAIVETLAGEGGPDHEGLATVVRTLVRMGLPIAPPDVILGHVAADHAAGVDPIDTAEFLVTALRPATVDIEIEPLYARQLTGLSLTDHDPSQQPKAMRSAAREALAFVADGLFYELGVRVPPLRFVSVADLPPRVFRTRIGVKGQTWLGIAHDHTLVDRTASVARADGLDASPAVNPANDAECATVPASENERAVDAGYATWDALGYLILALAADLRQCAPCLVDVGVIERDLAVLHAGFPSLVDAALERFTTSLVARVGRRLLAQQVSIRNLRGVLEAMLGYEAAIVADTAKRIVFDDRVIVDEALDRGDLPGAAQYELSVRKQFRRYLAHKYARGGSTINVYLLDADAVEQPIARALEQQAPFDLDPLRAALNEELAGVAPSQPQPAILTNSTVAAYLRERLAVEFPGCGVLSYDEIPASTNLQPIARLSP